MKVKFDSLNRFEQHKLYLCNPGSECKNGQISFILGSIPFITDEEITFNFNAQSEINFRVHKVSSDDPDEQTYADNIYESIKSRRMIFVDDIGYFIISDVTDGYSSSDAGSNVYKDVRAESVESELKDKMLPFVEDGTYKFSEISAITMSNIPKWTIGVVDPQVEKRSRTFEDVGTDINTLSFFQQNLQDAYECIFEYDAINRVINVYDKNSYFKNTDIHITREDVINSVTVRENSEELYTALRVTGDEELNISPVNPLGTNVIYNFDYYLPWMSDPLRNKVLAWEREIANNETTYYDLNLQYYSLMTNQYNTQMDIDKYNIQLSLYKKCRENIIAENSKDTVGEYNKVLEENGAKPIDISGEIQDVLMSIDALSSEVDQKRIAAESRLSDINAQIAPMQESIKAIQTKLDIKKYFTESEHEELYNYLHEGKYTDEYTTVSSIMSYDEKFSQMKVLYDRAKQQIEVISSPGIEMSVDTESFIFSKNFSHFTDQLETGCIINAEIEENTVTPLFLSSVTVNYQEMSMSMTFGNKRLKFDQKTIFDSVLGNVSKSANTIEYIKDIIAPVKEGELDKLKEALQTARNLSMDTAIASSDEEVVIDGSGYTGRKKLSNGEYDPRQIKIVNNSIVFTDDAWETCKLALGEILFGNPPMVTYGINAQTIIGEMIVGGELHIVDTSGKDIFTIMDDKINLSVIDLNQQISSELIKINQSIASINVNAGKIETSVSEVNSRIDNMQHSIDGTGARIDEVEKKVAAQMTAEDIKIQISETVGGGDTEGIAFKTETGFVLDKDGLTIGKSNSKMETSITDDGMRVYRDNNEVLRASNEGVDATNLRATTYLIVGGRIRLENYGTNRVACFWIGG